MPRKRTEPCFEIPKFQNTKYKKQKAKSKKQKATIQKFKNSKIQQDLGNFECVEL